MNPIEHHIQQTRREFLTTSANGIGALALGSLLTEEGILSANTVVGADPLALRRPQFPAKAKNCIFIFLEGGPSQMDLYDPKPKLNELHGQPLPESMTKNVRFAFIRKETARIMGTKRVFKKHGECGMDFSDYLPHMAGMADDWLMIRSMHTDQFNHHPGQLVLHCGRAQFGLPTIGSWLNYGLGSESRNLPGYVVLSSGRGTSGGASLWQSGFLPSSYAGVLFRNQGEPVLNLKNPAGVPMELQRKGLDALMELNQSRYDQFKDPEIASRISAYELAFRMQAAAPELIDLKDESDATLAMYGVNRPDAPIKASRGGGPGQYKSFATNCLLARRLVERGVRYVSLMHASWDHHSNLDNELAYNAGMADQPVAALLRDLKQRGLLDSTMVVFAGEFGRTPLGENRGGNLNTTGRDHHPFAFTILAAGGGLKGGQVYGETDEIGWGIVKDPVDLHDFHATMLHLFGFDHLKLTHRFSGRDFRLTDVSGRVIKEWIA
ncbi:MAG: DUF1501 domain-containing protein [Verrucomicrobiaceae bacterium]|nr:DUF1501 domain-containing protein [Verrucomicrobiaceae bacterium]